MTSLIMLPGIGGSEEEHWQTRWERADPAIVRLAPRSWNKPELTDWIAALERAVSTGAERPVLVAHSLACLLVAHWAKHTRKRIAGAFLVGVPDPAGPRFPVQASTFREVPEDRLPFPALVIASTDDLYGTSGYARNRAHRWGAGFIELGAFGHISAASGLGDWPQGRALLEAFCAGATKSV